MFINLIKHNSFHHNRFHPSFHCKTRMPVNRKLYIKSVNHQTSRNLLSHDQTSQTSTQRSLSCWTKSTRIKTNLAAQVTISISKSQSFMISVDESDYHQMPTSMAPQSYYPVKLKCIIMLIAVTLLSLTNFAPICSCFSKILSGNVLTWLNGRHLASQISSPQIPLCLQPNAFESFVLSLILYNERWILLTMVLYTLVNTSFEHVEVILLWLPVLEILH